MAFKLGSALEGGMHSGIRQAVTAGVKDALPSPQDTMVQRAMQVTGAAMAVWMAVKVDGWLRMRRVEGKLDQVLEEVEADG